MWQTDLCLFDGFVEPLQFRFLMLKHYECIYAQARASVCSDKRNDSHVYDLPWQKLFVK